ncbi:MAG: FHA domain-containing protein [Deltaproteobacteria bacterium]|nr:FHA domain-containing protein [Deltaproteobacteria bacterium]
MANLRVTTNNGRTTNFTVDKKDTSIGRSKDNDIVLSDHTVSRYHARLILTKEGYLLTDLGSFNGIRINDKSVQSALLTHGDRILIGNTKATFFTREKPAPSFSDSLILTTDSDFEKGFQKIVKTSSEESLPKDSQELLISIESMKPAREPKRTPMEMVERAQAKEEVRADVSSLERSNKVLFVLYEIARQLNSIHDFNELLNKIMDLIFMVIDADYGFLILTGEGAAEELIPVVVKARTEQETDKNKLRASRTIINKVIHDKVALLTSNAMADTRLDHAKSLFIQQIRSAMCVPLWKKDKIIGVIQLESVRFDNQFDQNDLELLKAIGSQMAMVIEQASLNEQIREEERMRSRLERFHSPQIIDMILRGGQETKDNIMEPKDLTATILFTDINGFTQLSERMPPRKVNMILNEYFSRMTDIVFKYDGTLDKYIGDGLMAVFGAPMEKADDAERAIMAAKEMIGDLAAMMAGKPEEERFTIRIGINTGRVVAGNIGSPKRMDYSVIGDPVNTASRLESLARPNQILIGEETFQHVSGKFDINRVGPKKVKGKTAEVMVYEVL